MTDAWWWERRDPPIVDGEQQSENDVLAAVRAVRDKWATPSTWEPGISTDDFVADLDVILAEHSNPPGEEKT